MVDLRGPAVMLVRPKLSGDIRAGIHTEADSARCNAPRHTADNGMRGHAAAHITGDPSGRHRMPGPIFTRNINGSFQSISGSRKESVLT